VDGTKIYHAGDTDPIPEMEGLDVDIAMLPVSGVYVATAEEAVEAANKIKPKTVIPMHYGSIVGSRADAERFKELWPGEVVIMEPQPS
jgi:L-ascorbate metabolism protein UlaG (beta-lactamase superfamily)